MTKEVLFRIYGDKFITADDGVELKCMDIVKVMFVTLNDEELSHADKAFLKEILPWWYILEDKPVALTALQSVKKILSSLPSSTFIFCR